MLTADERTAIRRFLASEGYDASDEDLMANEGQAYLIHTTDPRFFTPAVIGMSAPRLMALRSAFIAAIPEAWLKQTVPNPPPAATVQPASVPALPAVPALPPKPRPPRNHHNHAAHPARQPTSPPRPRLVHRPRTPRRNGIN